MGKDKKLCADVPTTDLHILDFVNNWGYLQTSARLRIILKLAYYFVKKWVYMVYTFYGLN